MSAPPPLRIGLGAAAALAFQVFEHLPEPRPALAELLRLTRPGGLVLVHTDMEAPERDERGFTGWWYVAPPDHCCLFRHRTFAVPLAGTPHRIVWRDPKSVLIEVGAGGPGPPAFMAPVVDRGSDPSGELRRA